MNIKLIDKLHNLSRTISTFIVPEFVWPKAKIIDNVPIRLRDTPYSFGIKVALYKGLYEGPERNLIRQYDFDGEIIIEMGGSIGIFTAILANKLGNSGRLISIEASKKLSSYSRSWLEINRNVSVLTGFAFPVGKLELFIDIKNFDESPNNLCGQVKYKISENRFINDNSIYDIQKVSKIYNILPTILVADIEGSENIILYQKPNFPSTLRLIMLELHPEFYGEENKLEIIERIIKENFTIKSVEGNVYLFERLGL